MVERRNMATFSERLLELRTERGLSQAAAAAQIGITSRTYQRYESGEREAAISALVSMADLFGVSIDYLVGRSDSR